MKRMDTFSNRRTPYGYDGIRPSHKSLKEILPVVSRKLHDTHKQRPDLILASWPEIVGEKMARMSRASSFRDGLLFIEVSNSTLYQLLVQHEKPKLLRALRRQFPQSTIKDLIFRMG